MKSSKFPCRTSITSQSLRNEQVPHYNSHLSQNSQIVVARKTVDKKTSMYLFSTNIGYVGNIAEITSTGISIVRLPLIDIL
jgi:hypothetical protein